MSVDLTPSIPGTSRLGLPLRGRFLIGMGLALGAFYLDYAKPFSRTWSIFYLIPVLYAGWALRGRAEVLVYSVVLTSLLATPMVGRIDYYLSGTGFYNRGVGFLLGLLVIGLLRERRRHIGALQLANAELEERVRARTQELQIANESLRLEIAEREKVQTEQRHLESQLRQAQKMEAIGYLAGGIAHDFNNLLTVINGYCSILLEEIPADSPFQESVVEMERAGQRAADLTRQLLAFGRKQMLQPRILHINQSITSAESLIRRLLPENIRVSIDLGQEMQPIKADPGQLVQVFLNLASNARDAMPRGGHFHIKTDMVLLPSEQNTTSMGLRPGPHVRLRVSDTGVGMNEETRQHIFEPFFTTKDVGKGTGLGMASVYGIIRQSGGHIDVTSVQGQGSTFTILLPGEIEPEPYPEGTGSSGDGMARGNETILLVEDEAQVRTLAGSVLRGAGYHVVEARNGKEALAWANAKGSPPIDLLLTDIVMPEMGGLSWQSAWPACSRALESCS